MVIIADCIDTILKAIDTDGIEQALESVKARVADLAAKYPLPY